MLDVSALFVGKDASLIGEVSQVVRAIEPLKFEAVSNPDAVYTHPKLETIALVVAHLEGGANSGGLLRLLKMIAATGRSLPTLVIGERGDAPTASVQLLRAGAVDFLPRPLNLNRLTYLIDSLTLRHRQSWSGPLQSLTPPPVAAPPPAPAPTLISPAPAAFSPTPAQRAGLPAPSVLASSLADDDNFLIASPTMQRFMDQVKMVAPLDTTVLLGGETGTGKTRLARLIHESSPRANEPFLVVNCGALSASLIESEMFGHVKGSFTGADRDHTGKFAEVGRGTILLDEIDALPPVLQAKLLRVVENRVFEPVGSNKSQVMRARMLAASNKSLDREVAAGRFRSDLYFRLNVIEFGLPPLRARREAVPTLARHFLREFAGRNNRDITDFSPEAVQALSAYHWPGNIRELRNTIERAVALSPYNEVQVDDLPMSVRNPGPEPMAMPSMDSIGILGAGSAMSLGGDSQLGSAMSGGYMPTPYETVAPSSSGTLAESKKRIELVRIENALRKHGNNRLRAARELGISRVTLYKKLHEHGFMETYARNAMPTRPMAAQQAEV